MGCYVGATIAGLGATLGQAIFEPGVGEKVARGKIVSLVEYLKSIQRSD